jgi:ADP-ribose pyrophosphatase YjhB (NUDIX family)
LQLLFDDSDEHIDGHCDPDLRLDRVLGCAEKSLDPKMLLDPLEEQFYLPAVIPRRSLESAMDPEVNFCSACGCPVNLTVPPGDNMPRHVCDSCQTIHYHNPKLVVGSLPVWGEQVLLCRRAIEPRHGKWTLPAGFMENGETVADAAIRETREEACARIALGEVSTMISLPHISQVHVIYLAELLDQDFAAGEETLELRLFREDEIPWDEIAFRTIHLTLKHYFADRREGRFQFRALELKPYE